jgi:hypothetical protein
MLEARVTVMERFLKLSETRDGLQIAAAVIAAKLEETNRDLDALAQEALSQYPVPGPGVEQAEMALEPVNEWIRSRPKPTTSST